MNVSIKKWIIVLFAVQLIIKLILSTSPYSSFDEREYIEFKNKTNAVPERGFLLEFLSYLFPSLLTGRIFVAIFSSFVVLILPFIKDKVVSKNGLFFHFSNCFQYFVPKTFFSVSNRCYIFYICCNFCLSKIKENGKQKLHLFLAYQF